MINRLQLTKEQLRVARERASENFKKLVVWPEKRKYPPVNKGEE